MGMKDAIRASEGRARRTSGLIQCLLLLVVQAGGVAVALLPRLIFPSHNRDYNVLTAIEYGCSLIFLYTQVAKGLRLWLMCGTGVTTSVALWRVDGDWVVHGALSAASIVIALIYRRSWADA